MLFPITILFVESINQSIIYIIKQHEL